MSSMEIENNNNSPPISIKDGKYMMAANGNSRLAQQLFPNEQTSQSQGGSIFSWFRSNHQSESAQESVQKAIDYCEKNNLYWFIPWFVLQMRFTPQEAAYLLVKWLDKHDVSLSKGKKADVRKALVWRTTCQNSLKTALHQGQQEPTFHQSWMLQWFHPAPSFPKLNLPLINKIFTSAGEAAVTSQETQSLEGLYNVLSRLERLCGVEGVDPDQINYRERKRKAGTPTYTAVYPGLTHKERKTKLHKSLWHFRAYNKALQQAGRLRGRLRNFFNPFITQTCAQLDKTGLATVLIKDARQFVQSDPLTVIFVALASSEFSQRKGFTLESQQHGALEDCLAYLFQLLQESKTTQWDLVATLYPMQSVLSHLDQNKLSYLLEKWIKLQIPVAKYLESQWNLGVETCAQKNMMVPRRGTTKVSSGGWNVVAGTWNNVVRFVRAISNQLQQQPPVFMKCLKLTAADQMQWAESVGQDEQVDIRVFLNLVNKGITPWGIMLGQCQCTESDILKACEEEKVDPKRWLGAPQERSKQSKLALDMICGVSVPSDLILQEILKTLGAYGYKPYQENMK